MNSFPNFCRILIVNVLFAVFLDIYFFPNSLIYHSYLESGICVNFFPDFCKILCNIKMNVVGVCRKPAAPSSDDPNAGLMDMMKQMYDDGDDEMKRTIAKAWTESREKGGAPPMM